MDAPACLATAHNTLTAVKKQISAALLQSVGGRDGGSDPAAASSPQPIRPRDTVVQDYLGREGAEQFLSDWDDERSSTSSLFSSPPSDDDGDAGAALAALEQSKWVQPQLPSPLPLPPILPPEGRPSFADDGLPSLSLGQRRHVSAPERRPEPSAAASSTSRLDDPSLEKWASSMMALGKAARLEAGVGAGADNGETQKVLGGDLAAVFATDEPRPASGAPGFRDSSPSGSHRSSRALEGDGSSSDGSSSVPQVDQRDHRRHRDRQRHRQAYRALHQGREEENNSAEGEALGDVSVPRRSTPRTSERKGLGDIHTDDVVEAVGTSRAAETPTPEGSSSSPQCGSELHDACGSRDDCSRTTSVSVDKIGGRGDVDGGVSVGVGAVVGGGGKSASLVQEDPGCPDRKVCVGEDESVVSEEEVVPRNPPRRSLLDLADQSIDDI